MDIQLKWRFGLGSPAAIHHDGVCEEVLIDPLLWFSMSREEREFILHHELAHCRYDIYDEVEADLVGFSTYVKAGGNPNAAYGALEELPQTPAIQHRMQQIRQQIAQFSNGEYKLEAMYPYRNNYSYFNGPCEDPVNQYEPACAWYWGNGNGGNGNDKDFDYWLDQAIDIIGAVAALKSQNQPYQGYPPAYYPPPQNQGTSSNVLIIGGIALVLVIVLLVLKK